MKTYLIGLVLITVASVQARTFNNPILADTDYLNPAAIKVNETYYVVAQTSDADERFPIHTSTDLINWNPAGYVFNDTNTPKWARVFDPEIQKIGINYIVYFHGYLSSTLFAVGAAIAPHPLGPYTPIDGPILPLSNDTEDFPTIINDQDKLYLLYRGKDGFFHARQFNSDGLSYSSDQATTLLMPSLDWETNFIFSPWYIRRGNYHYILYSGGKGCIGLSIGVARSSNALGPYEKLPYPILGNNTDYTCVRYPCVVKDLDDKGDIIFFNAVNVVNIVSSVLLASLGWGADDWPYVEDF